MPVHLLNRLYQTWNFIKVYSAETFRPSAGLLFHLDTLLNERHAQMLIETIMALKNY